MAPTHLRSMLSQAGHNAAPSEELTASFPSSVVPGAPLAGMRSALVAITRLEHLNASQAVCCLVLMCKSHGNVGLPLLKEECCANGRSALSRM